MHVHDRALQLMNEASGDPTAAERWLDPDGDGSNARPTRLAAEIRETEMEVVEPWTAR